MKSFFIGFIQGVCGYIIFIGIKDILSLNTIGGDNAVILIIMCLYICVCLFFIKEIIE